MFTFSAMPVKYVTLCALFAWCVVWGVVELRRAQNRRQHISSSLHLTMAVVMLAMVPGWSWHNLTSVFPSWVLATFFGLSACWFAAMAVDAHRGAGWRQASTAIGHTLMFLAMTWHLTGMAIMEYQMSHPASSGGMGGMGDMGGMGGMGHPMQTSHDAMWWIAVIGVPIMTYLLVAAIADLRKVFAAKPEVNHNCICGDNCTCGPDCDCPPAPVPASTPEQQLVLSAVGGSSTTPVQSAHQTQVAVATCHAPRPVGSPVYRLGALADFAMNFGMFWMSTGLLVAVLPFFSHLSF